MKNLDIYKKVQIILLILIIISLVVFIITLTKSRNVENYTSEETSSDITEMFQEPEEEIYIADGEDDNSWDEQEEEDTKVDLTQEENSVKNNSSTYYIKVNYTANVVTVYSKDSSGEYTVPVMAFVCSTGTATPTSGVYAMSDKYRWHTLNGGVQGQYCSRITGHILFHSVPYSSQSPDTLKYTAYDKLGTKASAGCIRLTVADAKWIYTNCPSGTYVEFYSSSNPGPLGKPTAQKISSNEECRNWDPTDPDPRNPWKSYVESSEQSEEEVKQTDVTTNTQDNVIQQEENTNTTQGQEQQQEENNTEENKTEENKESNNENETDSNVINENNTVENVNTNNIEV